MIEEVYKKYNVLTDGLERRYVLPLPYKEELNPKITPRELAFLYPKKNGKGETFMEKVSVPLITWDSMIVTAIRILNSIFPRCNEEYCAFRVTYYDGVLFYSDEDDITEDFGGYNIYNDLYFVGDLPRHIYVRLLSDILIDFHIKKAVLTVHKPGIIEPLELLLKVREMRKVQFVQFLKEKHHKKVHVIKTILGIIDALDVLFKDDGGLYTSLYDIDNHFVFMSSRTSVLIRFEQLDDWTPLEVQRIVVYLGYLQEFFASLTYYAKVHKKEAYYHFEEEE